MLIKIILIYILVGAILDLIGRIILRNKVDEMMKHVKSFSDVCVYILGYLVAIISWPIWFIKGIMLGIKDHD